MGHSNRTKSQENNKDKHNLLENNNSYEKKTYLIMLKDYSLYLFALLVISCLCDFAALDSTYKII